MGYTFEGDKFLPDNTITKEELFKLLNIVRSYVDESKYESLDKVTKLDAIKMITDTLGLEKVAKLSSIYRTSFNDVSYSDDIGYIALAEGLELVSGDSNNNFNPNKELSRIEAICIALKLANIK